MTIHFSPIKAFGLAVILIYSNASYAKNVGFKDGPFFLKTDIEWAKDKTETDQYAFHLCAAKDALAKENTLCFAISLCWYSATELNEQIVKIEDETTRSEFETMMGGSFQSQMSMQEFMKLHMDLLRAVSAKKKCVLSSDLPKMLEVPAKEKKTDDAKK